MTLNEVDRAIKSKIRVDKMLDKKRATFDYLLADLIGRSNARIHSSSSKMPTIYEAYPTLYEEEEIKQQQADNLMKLSEIRFKQFAQSYNLRFKEGRSKNE